LARILHTTFLTLLITAFGLGLVQAQTATPAPTATLPPEPTSCLRPPDDYSRVQIGESTLNARTVAMLAHAQTLYEGTIDLTGTAVTQGSYNEGTVALSFGTHDGGGAVDISVRNIPIDWTILWDDIPLVIQALRTAGFAAWYRNEEDEMTPHIHAIAIGDAELSRAASLQLIGRYGYFRGYDGLPQPDGVPLADADGEPVLCNWMRELGYDDLREETTPITLPYQFQLQDTVLVNTVWGQELNLRAEPSRQSEILLRLASETPLTLLDGPRQAEGFQWWLVQTESGDAGWVVDAADGGLTLVK
jgi:hypothetical protein